MSKQPADKEKPAKPPKSQHSGEAEAKPKKAKAAPEGADAKVKADAKGKDKEKEKEAPAEKEKPAPRPPADPRLKVLKKFYGKFLPRGPLRDRHKALMARWNSGEDHGGVTVDELKSLHEDWKKARAKPVRAGSSG
jgi:hypothetical protein